MKFDFNFFTANFFPRPLDIELRLFLHRNVTKFVSRSYDTVYIRLGAAGQVASQILSVEEKPKRFMIM